MIPMEEKYMQRAIQLAKRGLGYTAPNPLVGAILVFENNIIGEGYHEHFGQTHAEVNAIQSVKEEDKNFISKSTLYVTLEPCSHQGKTPPCSDFIIEKDIPKVYIGSMDPNPQVAGKGIKKLKDAGITVTTGICPQECGDLNKRFFTYHKKKRPYIILKWVQSRDGFIASPGPKPKKISNPYTDRIVHRWRSEEQAILVGRNTAEIDNPALTNRLWTGKTPVRIILDRDARLPHHLTIFNDGHPTLIYNKKKSYKKRKTEWIQVHTEKNFVDGVFMDLFQRKYLSVMIEGGAKILHSFLEKELWDEIRIIQGKGYLQNGLPAPKISFKPTREEEIEDDRILRYER